MTDDLSLFVGIAEIAGVFVGFGALIALTRRDESARRRHGQIGGVVTIGLVAVVAALLPVVVARYGIDGHDLWFVCSAAFLVLVWAVIVVALRTRELRDVAAEQARRQPVAAAFFWVMLELPIQIPLVLILLGIRPDLDAAFYTTALVFNLFEAAFVLAQLVYASAANRDA